jgi:hypothetical protein
MIKSQIQLNYIHQFNAIINFSNDVFVADYTELTKTHSIKRSVEFFSPNPPGDIDYFSIINSPKLSIDGIEFDNTSFTRSNGEAKTQCESVFFPHISANDSWILFCELKYSSRPLNNRNNLKKAINQLFKTRYYYYQENIINSSNTSYLIASLPLQSEPFTNFSITPALLTKLKSSRNIVLRLKNSVEIVDDKIILV